MGPLYLLLLAAAYAAVDPGSDREFVEQGAAAREGIQAAQAEARAVADEERAFLEAGRVVAALVSPNPERLRERFTDAFFRQYSESELRDILEGLHERHGPVLSVEAASRLGLNGTLLFKYRDGWTQRVSVAVKSPADPRIEVLIPHPPSQPHTSLRAALEEFKRLPGKTGLLVRRLDRGSRVLLEHEPEAPLAVASASKLYILQAVKEGGLWDERASIKRGLQSWPSGDMHRLPAGQGLGFSGREYAARMIGRSDNTATDHLLAMVGRETVEASLARLGHRHAAMNVPYLAVHEAYKLKSDPALLARWKAAGTAGRRGLLAELADKDLGLPPESLKRPSGIDSAEWFASPGDVCRLLAVMHEENDPVLLATLQSDPGASGPTERFAFNGFKGGSEPGVFFEARLLRTWQGAAYCLAAGANDPAGSIDAAAVSGLLQGLLAHLPEK